MKKLAGTVLLVMCLLLSGCKDGAFKSKGDVEFQEFLIERSVREVLGKEWNDPISKKEMESIEKLTLCYLDDTMLAMNLSGTYDCGFIYHLDLSDLQYLTGLKELIIDMPYENTSYTNLDALTSLKNLEKLTMGYSINRNMAYYGSMTRGYKYFANIFSQLPKLRYVDLGVNPADDYVSWFRKYTDHEIEFADYNSEERTPNSNLYSSEFMHARRNREEISDWSDYKDEFGYQRSASKYYVPMAKGLDLNNVPEDVEDLIIDVEDMGSVDLRPLEKLKHLKTLAIWGSASGFTHTGCVCVELQNAEVLSNLSELSVVSLWGVSVDMNVLGDMKSLRELSLGYCQNVNYDAIKKLSGLRELVIWQGSDSYAEELAYNTVLPDAYGKLSSLRYLNLYTEPECLLNVSAAPKLKSLAWQGFFFDDKDAKHAAGEIAKSKTVENLYFAPTNSPMTTVTDMDIFATMTSLKSFCGYVSVTNLNSFFEKKQDMVSVVAFLYAKDGTVSGNPVETALYGLDEMFESAADLKDLSCLGFIFCQGDLGRMSMQEAGWEILYHAGIFDMYRQGEVTWNYAIPDTKYYLENGYF